MLPVLLLVFLSQTGAGDEPELEDGELWFDSAVGDPMAWWSGVDDRALEPSEFLDELLREAAALRLNPLDLNSATVHELARIPGLDPVDAAAIVALRNERGRFERVDDLASSPRFSLEFVRALRPYLRCSPAPSLRADTSLVESQSAQPTRRTFMWSVRVRSSWNIDPANDWATEGVADLLPAAAPFARLRMSRGDSWRAGASFERDPWERDLLDHTALHVSWRSPRSGPRSHRGSCVLGNILINWGQGLLAGAGMFSSPTTFPRRADRARGYDGAGEVRARRGVHAALGRGCIDAKVVGTVTALDAAIDEDGLASSIRTSGRHRTEGERAGAGALTESCLGGRVTLAPVPSVVFGCSALSLGYSPGLARGDVERQRFRFHGDELGAASADLKLSGESWIVGAEWAATSFGGRGIVAALRAGTSRAYARAGCGHLSREFWLPQGGGLPGCSGGTNGTSGWVGAGYSPSRALSLRAEALVHGRPWRSYSSELPDVSERVTLGASARLAGLGSVDAEIRVRSKTAASGEAGVGTRAETSSRTRVSVRTDGKSPLCVTIIRSVSECDGADLGTLIAVAARWETEVGGRSLITAGVTTATSRGEVAPVVLYEPGLPGTFALRTLNASGTRWYIRLKVGASERMGFTARLSGGPGRGEYSLGLSVDAKG